jgi:hypothetical protein
MYQSEWQLPSAPVQRSVATTGNAGNARDMNWALELALPGVSSLSLKPRAKLVAVAFKAMLWARVSRNHPHAFL